MNEVNTVYLRNIDLCQKILRLLTGVILGAFIAIIIITTISTGPLVQTAGKLLYFLILSSAFACLVVWLYRGWMEKRLEPENSSNETSN